MPLLDVAVEILLLVSKNLGLRDLSRLIRCSRPLAFHLTHVLHNLALQDVEDEYGMTMTALQWAASHGHESLVRLLLNMGVQIDATLGDNVGDSSIINPLHAAVINGHQTIVKFLLENGAGVNYEAIETKSTALHRAVEEKCESEEMIKLLLKWGADVRAIDEGGDTPLHIAALNGYGPAVQLLLKHGSDISAQNDWGETALHMAIQVHERTVIRLLVENGADVTISNGNGSTALHYACMIGHQCDTSIALLLLENEADINAIDHDGKTALHHAADTGDASGQEPLIRVLLLLRFGADISIRDNTGLTAVEIAAVFGEREVQRALYESLARKG